MGEGEGEWKTKQSLEGKAAAKTVMNELKSTDDNRFPANNVWTRPPKSSLGETSLLRKDLQIRVWIELQLRLYSKHH